MFEDYKITIQDIKYNYFHFTSRNNLNSIENNYMDKWNVHCISNHVIDSNKIKICCFNNSYKLKDIFNYAVKETKLDLKNTCPILYDYLINHK